ncbi:MAG: ion transporter [Phycisphaerales bacterium]|nr:MAG: ion transporter [Phycisphaerales bacterium]
MSTEEYQPPRPAAGLRGRVHEIIYEADTPAGKAFDVALLGCIVLSVFAAVLESVEAINAFCGAFLRAAEWLFTILFTIEYVLRLLTVRRPLRYALSFYGIVDLMAIVPTYLSVFIAGTQSLIVIRALRLLRVFRVFKLAQYLIEAKRLKLAMQASGRKIVVFLGVVITLVLILGTLMYLIEGGPGSQFTSIPRSIYWAIVTMTTVGYGDIAPQTPAGQVLASVVMIIGYAIIVVPTSIVTAELVGLERQTVSTQACPACSAEGHDVTARHCKYCGAGL